VVPLVSTHNDPFAALVRKELRKRGVPLDQVCVVEGGRWGGASHLGHTLNCFACWGPLWYFTSSFCFWGKHAATPGLGKICPGSVHQHPSLCCTLCDRQVPCVWSPEVPIQSSLGLTDGSRFKRSYFGTVSGYATLVSCDRVSPSEYHQVSITK
jgi:hypothetical protein